MLQINIQSDLEKAMRKLQSITEKEQFRFAAAKALTQTAAQVQAEVRKNMPSRFILRRQWVVQGIRITPAKKSDLTATVYSRDKFMGLQEFGGAKSPLRNHIAIPTTLVRRTKRDMITKADRPTALGDKLGIVEFRGNKYLALKKPRTVSNGNKLRFMYLLVPRAEIKERLGLGKDGVRVARQRFMENLEKALQDAVRSAR